MSLPPKLSTFIIVNYLLRFRYFLKIVVMDIVRTKLLTVMYPILGYLNQIKTSFIVL